jgi:hypothetical protein
VVRRVSAQEDHVFLGPRCCPSWLAIGSRRGRPIPAPAPISAPKGLVTGGVTCRSKYIITTVRVGGLGPAAF